MTFKYPRRGAGFRTLRAVMHILLHLKWWWDQLIASGQPGNWSGLG